MLVLEKSSVLEREIKKLFYPYRGPFLIKQKVSPNTYEIFDVASFSMGIHNVINMKSYIEPVTSGI